MTVDHIEPRSRRPDLATDPANLQTLCGPCHGSAKQHHEKAAGDVLAGGSAPTGWPADPGHPWNMPPAADAAQRLLPRRTDDGVSYRPPRKIAPWSKKPRS